MYRENDRWLYGPAFLQTSIEKEMRGPPLNDSPDYLLDVDKECRKLTSKAYKLIKQVDVIHDERYSSWNKYVRLTGRLFRIKNYKSHINSNYLLKDFYKENPELTQEELVKAELYLLRRIQLQAFPEEFQFLSSGIELDSSNCIFKLAPYFDKDIELIRLND